MKAVGDLASGCDDTKRARLNGDTDGLASCSCCWSFLPRFLLEVVAILLLAELLQEAAAKSIAPGLRVFSRKKELRDLIFQEFKALL